ncbi:Disease resistance protein RPS5 [Spatholobus suberectus]|nr:Disease resistance protein RPS5 [Spatholobus suberectus]
MRMLKVLFLKNEGWVTLPLSTMSFKTLTDLRCLILCNWKLSGISFVRDMKKLQSLSLYDCSLPSFLELQTDAVVTHLTNLKLLVLHECDMERNNFEVIRKIPQLEELCIIDSSEEWDDCSEFFKTFSIPRTLQCYVIKLGDLDDDDDDNGRLSCFSDKRTLLLSHFHISNGAIKDLAKKAKVLLMANIQGGAKNIIPDIFHMKEGGMNELNELQICNSKEIEYLVDTSNHLSEAGSSVLQVA